MQKKEKDNNPPPVMNTLKVELLNNGKYQPMAPNSREPVPFETDFFKGTSMIVVRTAPIDEHYRMFFEGKKRLFEVQVQGKFKRLPAGEVFVGAEASLKMELGLISRSVAKAAINLCSTMVGDLHSSLGDMKGNELYQLPHLVAPLFITFDKIVLTQPGETPPPLGIPFTEDLEYRKKRLKFRSIKDANVDLNTIYSFSVNTSNINLLTWNLCGIPLVRPMDLRTFIQESAIRLVGYEIPDAVLAQNPNDHPCKKLNYVFNMNLRSVDPEEEMDLPLAQSEGEDGDGEGEGEGESDDGEPDTEVETGTGTAPGVDEGDGTNGPVKMQQAEVALLDHREPDGDLDGDELPLSGGSDEDEKERGPKINGHSRATSPMGTPRPQSSANRGVSGWIRKHMSVGRDHGKGSSAAQDASGGAAGPGEMPDIEVADVFESTEYSLTDYEMEATGDLAFCPGCLEMIHEGRRRILYFIPLPEGHERTATVNILDDIDLQAPRLRPFSEIAKVLNLVPIPRMHKNKRLSSLEKRRRQIVESYRVLLKSDPSGAPMARFMTFLNQVAPADRDYLDGNASVSQRFKSRGGQESECWEGCAGMATSRRHWVEFHLVVNKTEVGLYRKQHSNRASLPRRPAMRISMSSIVAVQPMRFQDILLQGFSFFQVETFSRVYYFMVRSDIQLQQWIEAFVHFLGKEVLHSPFDDSYHGANGPTPSGRFSEPDSESYLAKSGCWKLDKKRIFNYRRIIFNPAAISSKYSNMTPNAFIEGVLANVLLLAKADSNKNNALQWVRFMDEISWLQTVDVSRLNDTERIAFFLNLYHVMVLHGSLVVGPPPAWNYWNAFFNNITYLFGYEIISIADIDFNILRAAMARPSSLSIIPVPQHQFPGLAVTQKDFRLNFCINNGSKSMPSMVPIYSPDYLDELLDEMTARTLLVNTEIDLAKKTITLPKVSLLDFTTRRTAAAGGVASPLDCVRALLYYFSPEDRILATRILNENIHVTIRFKNQSLRCRKLHVYNPKEASGALKADLKDTGEFDITNGDFLVDIYQELVA